MLTQVGFYLPSPIFSHGQFYVTYSQTGKTHNFKILVKHNKMQNFQQEVSKKHDEILQTFWILNCAKECASFGSLHTNPLSPTSIWLQRSASIQPRTSRPRFWPHFTIFENFNRVLLRFLRHSCRSFNSRLAENSLALLSTVQFMRYGVFFSSLVSMPCGTAPAGI